LLAQGPAQRVGRRVTEDALKKTGVPHIGGVGFNMPSEGGKRLIMGGHCRCRSENNKGGAGEVKGQTTEEKRRLSKGNPWVGNETKVSQN